MEIYCANCGTVHAPGLSPLLCRQRRDGALASYGRILDRDEVVGPAAIAVEKPEKTGGGTSPAERFLAAEGRARARGRSGSCVPKPKPSLPGVGLAERLARTEQRLAELRETKAKRMARYRAKKRGGL